MKEQLYYNKKISYRSQFKEFIKDKKKINRVEIFKFLKDIGIKDFYQTYYIYKSKGFLKNIKVLIQNKNKQLYYKNKRTITGRFRQFIQDKKESSQEELIDFLDSINCNDPYGTFYSYKSQGFLKKIKVIYPEKTEFKKKVIKFIKNKKTIHQDKIVNFLRKIGHSSPKIYFGTLKYINLFKGKKIIPIR